MNQDFFKAIWLKYKGKIVVFVLGVIITLAASLTGTPVETLKSWLHEASEPAVVTAPETQKVDGVVPVIVPVAEPAKAPVK